VKYYDSFGEGGFHSAFLTTYAFGTIAFENIPFSKLKGARCRNITVLADRAMVNQASVEYGPPRFAGTSYHLVKCDAPGAFHPKITMLLGEKTGRLRVGSANLTALGLGGNKEQIASISYSEEEPSNARYFKSALAYLRHYVPDDDPWFETSVDRALRSSTWLRDGDFEPGFSGAGTRELDFLCDRPETNLLEQIITSIGDDQIERLVILSPYWDTKLDGLARLRNRLGGPLTDILIEVGNNGFPSDQLARFGGVSLYDVAEGKTGRFWHAKLIIALGAKWDHIISGSMNCTQPALMGPAAGGNAEAAIYKRVARGTALEALHLNSYQGSPVRAEQFEKLQECFDLPDPPIEFVDGGSLVLRSDTLLWTRPRKIPAAPRILRLHDRDGRELRQLEGSEQGFAPLTILSDEPRPKSGIMTFADGTVSAPIQVSDLDALKHNTRPPQKGRKKKIEDRLAEAIDEDLGLIEALDELEALQEEDAAANSFQAPKAKPESKAAIEPTYEVLSYDAFIRARTEANRHASIHEATAHPQHDRPSNHINDCLNRMIGLVGPDLAGIEEKDFASVDQIDFRTTEPKSDSDDDAPPSKPTGKERPRSNAARLRDTANKFKEAVSAFEARSKALKGKIITTAEMVRIRALLQIILNHARPLTGAYSPKQILPIYHLDGHDWPRLVGRLLLQHFGVARALQYLTVMPDESEQELVLEYLAICNWAAMAARAAVMTEGKANVVKGGIERLLPALAAQTQEILALLESDRIYYARVTQGLDDRFKQRLGL